MTLEATQFYPLEKLDKLHNGYRRSFEIAGEFLLLVQHNDKRYLLESICPHAGYPIDHGLIIDQQIRCPMHGYLFRLENGACSFYTEGPCRNLKTYELIERDSNIGVFL